MAYDFRDFWQDVTPRLTPTLPSISMVYTMTTPWTLRGRNTAIQKAVVEVYERYFAKNPRWVAKHLPQRAEMSEYGSRVSAESREILLGDFGVESFIEDYAVLAIRASGDSQSTRQIYRPSPCAMIWSGIGQAPRPAICAAGISRAGATYAS
jgi:hypothetical protein